MKYTLTTLSVLSALAVVACGGGDDSGSPTTGTTAACDVEVRETFPATGATTWYHRGTLEFTLSKADPDGNPTVMLMDGAGTMVQGTTSYNDSGTKVFFTPSAPLTPGGSYSATLSYCRGDVEIPFTCSSVGEPLSGGPESLIGSVYGIDLANGRVVIPEGVGDVLTQYIDFLILAGVNNANATSLEIQGALADEADPTHQDYCEPSIAFPTADFSEAPYFIIGPQNTQLEVAGFSVSIDALKVAGTFASDGSQFAGGELSGLINTIPLVDLLFPGSTDPNAVCSFIAGFGVSCIDCSDGSGPYCLELLAVDLVAERVSGAPPVEIIEQEDCHQNCAASSKNPYCTL